MNNNLYIQKRNNVPVKFMIESIYNELDNSPVKYLENLSLLKTDIYKQVALSGKIYKNNRVYIESKTDKYLSLACYDTTMSQELYNSDFIKSLCDFAAAENHFLDIYTIDNIFNFNKYHDILQSHLKDDIRLFLHQESKKYTQHSEVIRHRSAGIKKILLSIHNNFQYLKSLIENLKVIEFNTYTGFTADNNFNQGFLILEGFLFEISHIEKITGKELTGKIKIFTDKFLNTICRNVFQAAFNKSEKTIPLSSVIQMRYLSLLRMTLAAFFLSDNELLDFRSEHAIHDMKTARMIKRNLNRLSDEEANSYAIEIYSLTVSWIMVLASHIKSHESVLLS